MTNTIYTDKIRVVIRLRYGWCFILEFRGHPPEFNEILDVIYERPLYFYNFVNEYYPEWRKWLIREFVEKCERDK